MTSGPEVRSLARSQLAGYKVPHALVVIPAMHCNPNGKADYALARQQAEDANEGAGQLATACGVHGQASGTRGLFTPQ